MMYVNRAIQVAYLRPRGIALSKILGLAVLVAIGYSPALHAQNITATVLGTVRDPSGSAVAGANITLANTGTGVTRSTKTDGKIGRAHV